MKIKEKIDFAGEGVIHVDIGNNGMVISSFILQRVFHFLLLFISNGRPHHFLDFNPL